MNSLVLHQDINISWDKRIQAIEFCTRKKRNGTLELLVGVRNARPIGERRG